MDPLVAAVPMSFRVPPPSHPWTAAASTTSARRHQCPLVRTPRSAVPIWVDLMSADTDRARAFYGELFGWECQEPNAEFGGLRQLHQGRRARRRSHGQDGGRRLPDIWSIYLEVADAEATVAAVKELGRPGLRRPPMPVGDLGVMVVAADSTGAMIGMWQPGSTPGSAHWMEPGTPGWFELPHPRLRRRRWASTATSSGGTPTPRPTTPEFRYIDRGPGRDPVRRGHGCLAASVARGAPPAGRSTSTSTTPTPLAKVVELGGAIPPRTAGRTPPYGRAASSADRPRWVRRSTLDAAAPSWSRSTPRQERTASVGSASGGCHRGWVTSPRGVPPDRGGVAGAVGRRTGHGPRGRRSTTPSPLS